jgi:hypothetical protein
MRIITLEDLHQHVLDLWGKEDGIDWIDKMWSPAANFKRGTVRLHPIDSESAYAVALHEIGHIRQGPFEDLLIEERRAWEWAKANALVWTPTMQRTAEQCIRSYETDEAHLAAYYYDQLLAFVSDLLVGNDHGEQVYDALIRNAVELAEMYEHDDAREARRLLICLIDKHLAARRTLAAHRRLRAKRYTGRGGEERRKREAQIDWLRSRIGAANDPWIQAQIAKLKISEKATPLGECDEETAAQR